MSFWDAILKLLGLWHPPPVLPPVVPNDVWRISGNHAGQPVAVSASRIHGGAVYSLTHGGFEYVDATDNGRELQTAWQLNEHGEGENPTEAGASADGTPATHSSTVVDQARTEGLQLWTQAHLAYWFPFNGQITSPHRLSKTVTLGYFNENGEGLSNVLRHQITITIIGDQQAINVEGLTWYGPTSFTRFFSFNLATKVWAEIPAPDRMYYDLLNPTIVTTSDRSRAITLYGRTNLYHYGGSIAGGPPKLDCSCYQIHGPVAAGDYAWECFTIFGTFAEVVASLTALSTASSS